MHALLEKSGQQLMLLCCSASGLGILIAKFVENAIFQKFTIAENRFRNLALFLCVVALSGAKRKFSRQKSSGSHLERIHFEKFPCLSCLLLRASFLSTEMFSRNR